MIQKCTLGDLGLDSLMVVEIKQILEKDHDLIMSTKDIRSLTMEKIEKITKQEMNIPKHVENVNENGNFNKDTLSLEQVFETLYNPGTNGAPIFILPSVEGNVDPMKPMLEILSTKLPERPFIQINWITDNDSHESIQDVANYYLEHLRSSFPFIKCYDLLAYSFGCLIGHQIAVTCQNIPGEGKEKVM